MTLQKEFTYYIAPDHGWVAVLPVCLKAAGLTPLDFSADGSYVQNRNGFFYLEEDCDAPQFIAAYEASTGIKPVLREVHINSRQQIGIR
jgi:hypothetical protein